MHPTGAMDLVHSLYVPPGDGPFPTVIALHGWGANAQDLLGLAPYFAGGKCLALCPQGATELQVGPGVKGYGWFPLTPGQAVDPRGFVKASAQLRRFVEGALERYPIDTSKTVALGFSQGGFMGIDLVFREVERFAGLVVLSSAFPDVLAANLPEKPRLVGLPVLMIHGTEDPQVPVEQARASKEVFQRFGVELSYHEFAMGHEIRPEAMTTLVRWFREKVLAT